MLCCPSLLKCITENRLSIKKKLKFTSESENCHRFKVVVISLDIGAINLMETVKSDHILMTLEWTQNDLTYSFHITVVPPTPQVNYSTSTQVQIKVPYNVAYNMSILVSSCGQYNVTAFFKVVFYGEL